MKIKILNKCLPSRFMAIFMTLIIVLSMSPISAMAEEAAQASGANWLVGDYHTHTVQSPDASEQYMNVKNVLDHALETYGMDYLMLADHLRVLTRDADGNDFAPYPGTLSKDTPFYKAIIESQIPKIKSLQNDGKYPGKTIFSGFEWDMPGLDHTAIGILPDNYSGLSEDGLKKFDYLFNYNYNNAQVASFFTQEEIDSWGERKVDKTKNNTIEGIKWLKENYPESYALINHPSRKSNSAQELKIEDIRTMNDLAPHIAFGFEGIPGNQLGTDRGESPGYIYGGADVMIAKVGGIWDALLGEGRNFWTFSNPDFHFKISTNELYSSGYWPGEYSKNYTWTEGNDLKSIVNGWRSGKSFSVMGDIINALDFKAKGNGNTAGMGEHLQLTEGDETTVTIRFKSPETNNYEPITEHETDVTNVVKVDHVDLISGEVTGKISSDSPDYNKNTNDTTTVVKRFMSDEWTTDGDGYTVITYTTTADKNRYYRLRGTNLGIDVAGETDANGNPLVDGNPTIPNSEERFNFTNDRNYSDMWFYSNPIFFDVTPAQPTEEMDLTILHINDHHSHLDSQLYDLPLNYDSEQTNEKVRLQLGGMSYIDSLLKANKNDHSLFLQSGELNGTLYYSMFGKGDADFKVLNTLNPDAYMVGNHEFDEGDANLARLMDKATFPLLSGNMMPTEASPLYGKFNKPYIIKEVKGEKVAIIGVIKIEKTKHSSMVSDDVNFIDEIDFVKSQIAEVKEQGINKIVVLSHLGYDFDLILAKSTADIDIIVGGDTHNLLDSTGEMNELQLPVSGEYPTIVKNTQDKNVYVVQAWEYSNAMGRLDVKFDADGEIIEAQGCTILPVGEPYLIASGSNWVEPTGETLTAIKTAIAHYDVLIEGTRSSAVDDIVSPMKAQIEESMTQKIGTVSRTLPFDRVPTPFAAGAAANGSFAGQVVADAFLSYTQVADVAIQNAGGVRAPFMQGNFTMADALTILPFSNTIAIIRVKGSDIVTVLDEAMKYAQGVTQSTGAFPYSSHLRYDVYLNAPDGVQSAYNVEIKDRVSSEWSPIDLNKEYTVVTNSFTALGKDNYLAFARAIENNPDVMVDLEVQYGVPVIDYVQNLEEKGMPVTFDRDNYCLKSVTNYAASTTHTVTFNANGGTPETTTATVNSGAKAAKPADPVKSGFTFGGWFTESSFANAFDFNSPITANITLYAKWTATAVTSSYTVTFNANGGTPATTTAAVNKGAKAAKPANPARSGFTFGGWYKEAGGINVFNFNSPITANITLFAKWTSTSAVGSSSNGSSSSPTPASTTVVDTNQAAIEKAIRDNKPVEIKLSAAANSTVLNGASINALITAQTPVTFKNGAAVLTVKPKTLNEFADKNSDVKVSVTPVSSGSTANQSLIGQMFDFHITVNGNDVKQFTNPVSITVDLSGTTLMDNQIKSLSGARFNANGTVSKLGGTYDAKTGNFTMMTSKLSKYGVIAAPDLVSLSLTLDSAGYTLNNIKKSFNAAPVIENGRTLVPIRLIAESFNADVKWDNSTQTATIELDGKTLQVKIGQKLPGMDVPSKIIDNRTMVPLRFISEYFDSNVIYNDTTRTISIYK